MSQLLNGVKHQFQAQSDELAISQAKNAKSMVNAQFWPKIDFVASYTHYSRPYSLRPLAPTETPKLLAEHKPLPVSRNITRFQVNLSMPLFVKSLWTLAHKAEIMRLSARLKRRVDILKNQAAVVGANANWVYLENMKRALNQKRSTLLQTLKITKAQVNLGRKPKMAEYKVQEGVNNINIAINNIKIQEANLKSLIKTLTGINVKRVITYFNYSSFD